MFLRKVIAILPLFYAFACANIVNKGHLYDEVTTESIALLKRRLIDYFSKHNISLRHNREFHELWGNVSQVLKGVYPENFDFYKQHGVLPVDPDAKRNATELVRSKGLIAEEHYVTTADGYILMILRVKSPGAKPRNDALPVFLLHGLLSSCDCYINNLRNESLGFILADLGFDVWLGNIRGNRYSTKHQYLQPTDKKFWEWSFDEMGQYDVPVMVNYVLSQTGHHKLDFIGHSEGTTNLITSVIRNGQPLIRRINKFVALAPAIYVRHSKGLMKDLARFARIIQDVWDPIEKGDVFAHNGFISELSEHFCYFVPHLCAAFLHGMVGPGNSHFNETRVPMYVSHVPAGTSTQNMVHWSQQCEDTVDRLMYYDYGSRIKNFMHYKRFHPPQYDLSKFVVPTWAFFGDNDWLVSPPDRATLISALPNLKSTTTFPEFNHMDFVWGYNIANSLYRQVVMVLEI